MVKTQNQITSYTRPRDNTCKTIKNEKNYDLINEQSNNEKKRYTTTKDNID